MFLKHITQADAKLVAEAIIGACRLNGWDSEIQPRFLNILFKNLLQYQCDFAVDPGTDVKTFAAAITDSNKRKETIDLMLVVEMLSPEISQAVSDSVSSWANHLGLNGARIELLRDLAKKSIAKAQEDFYRNNYFSDKDLKIEHFQDLVKNHGLPAYIVGVEDDPAERARWEALNNHPEGSFGKELWNFYKKRGFPFPGTVDGVNPATAHHDWIHVLTGYDSDGIGEIEVAAYTVMATNSESPIMNFLGVLSIFQGGLLKSLVGTAPHLGHDLEVENGVERIIHALERGRKCRVDLVENMNFFEHAHRPLSELKLEWNIPA